MTGVGDRKKTFPLFILTGENIHLFRGITSSEDIGFLRDPKRKDMSRSLPFFWKPPTMNGNTPGRDST